MNRRPAAVILLVYLGLTLPLALLGLIRDPARVHFLAVHCLALVAMVAAGRRAADGRWGAVLDWAPLVTIPFLYAELPLLMHGAGSPYRDGQVQAWEAALFGASPAVTMAVRYPGVWASELLHLAYLSYYAIIYVPAVMLAVQRRRMDFLEMSTMVVLTFAACFAVFIVFPVQGPRYLWSADQVPSGTIRGIVVGILERGSSRGAAFPSSHVAVAVVQSGLMWRYQMPGAAVVSTLAAGLALGAVYGGFHYGVDALAGLAAGLAALAVAPLLLRRVSLARPAATPVVRQE